MGIFGLYQWIVSLCRHESGQVCTRVPVPSSNLEATSSFYRVNAVSDTEHLGLQPSPK